MSRRSQRRRRHDRDSANPVVFATPRVLSQPAIIRPGAQAHRHLVKTKHMEVDDRRRHHPLGFFRPAKQLSGHPVKPNKVGNSRRTSTLPHTIKFAAPKSTLICVRREQRKQVLFAKKKTKKGAGSRKRFRNWFSSVSCKRSRK